MNKRTTITSTIDHYFCEACDKPIVQDGKDIILIYEPRELQKKFEPLFHFHSSCLIAHLRKTWIPNP